MISIKEVEEIHKTLIHLFGGSDGELAIRKEGTPTLVKSLDKIFQPIFTTKASDRQQNDYL